MTACLHSQENALDSGFGVFAKCRRGETEEAKPEMKPGECAACGEGHCGLLIAWGNFFSVFSPTKVHSQHRTYLVSVPSPFPFSSSCC